MRSGFKPPPVHLNVISCQAGMGDQIARIPAFNHVLEAFKHVSQTIWVHDYFLPLAEYLLPSCPGLTWRKLSEAPYMMERPKVEFNMERLTTLQLHLTDHAFLILTDALPPTPESRQYIKAPDVLSQAGFFSKKLIKQTKGSVVFTVANTAPTREWPAFQINRLAKLVRAKGLQPVLLGVDKPMTTGNQRDDINPKIASGIDRNLFLDLTNKTTLIEALGIMQQAKAVVGVDNGLLHLAHCTDTPVVAGFTSLDPKHRVPAREAGQTEVIEADVPCNGCQSKGFAVNHDWRLCINMEHPYACTLTMSAERFFKKLVDLKVLDS